jgi:methylated-DNA-[protein]-cysteine S-methyltransferase
MTTYLTTVESPLGPLTLRSDGTHLTGLFLPVRPAGPPPEGEPDADAAPFPALVRQLAEYFAGERTAFDVPLAAAGTPFQQRVWSALRTIPYGTTVSYRDIAVAIDNPNAVRAVGLANGRNPIAIVVPCHRVVGSDGSLTGYGGGLAAKQQLLDLETRSDRLFAHTG